MTNEKEIKKYLSSCDKEALISLYLQMRFERDLWQSMYENIKVTEKGDSKEWTLSDSKVKYGYELAKKEWKNHGGCWGCMCKELPLGGSDEE